jgi:putative peptidoglycan lipid II flippase
VLFPRLSRLSARADMEGFRHTVAIGVRQIAFTLVPASVFSAVLATPIIRIVYERGAWGPHETAVTADALAAFSLGLTFNGVMLMLNRAFFSLQSPWIPTYIAVGNLALNAALAAALYRVGIWGIPLATSIVNIAGSAALLFVLRRRLGRVNGRELLDSTWRIVLASAVAAGVAYGVWRALDEALGRSLGAQVTSVGLGCLASVGAYLVLARLLGIRELGALLSLIGRSGRRSDGRTR